jgi:hypothetical protein
LVDNSERAHQITSEFAVLKSHLTGVDLQATVLKLSANSSSASMASSPTAPGVKIDKQTSLRLTSTKHYVEEDVSSLVSGMSNSSPEGEKKKGLLRKLQWRSPPANQGKRLPPSTSPLSRKLGAPKPSGKGRGRAGRNNRSKLSANRGNRNVCVSSSDNNLVSSSDATVASQKTSYTKTSQGTTVSTKTLKHSNKGMGQMG